MRSSERGLALVIVLWALVLLSIVAASVIGLGLNEARLTHNLKDEARAEALADAGIYHAILVLLDSRARLKWRVDGAPYQITFADTAITVSIQDERGRIDLNTANDALLAGLFESAGLSPDAAQTMTDRIADWRSPGDLKRLNGAKAEDYRRAGYAYGPRNGAFQSVSELKLVMGMTPSLYRAVAPALTLYSKAATVDPEVAPRCVLLALPAMTDDKVDDILKERENAGPDNGGDVAIADDAMLAGHAFSISSELTLPGGLRFKRQAVVRFTGDPKQPYWLHEWRSGEQ